MRWGRVVLSAVLFLLASAYVWEAFGYNPTPRLFPLLVGIPMVVLAALQAVIECFPVLSKRYAEAGTVDVESLAGSGKHGGVEEDPRQTQKELEAFLWLGLAVGLSMVFGMLSGIPLFMCIFLRLRHAASWTISVSLPLGTLLVLYLLFYRLFQIPLYPGWLLE